MKHDKRGQQVVHQELALDIYLRTLLEDIPESETEFTAKGGDKVRRLQKDAAKPLVQNEKIRPLFERVPPVAEIAPQLPVCVADEIEVKPQYLSVMPEWAQQEFQALFFKVDQLILATPLTELLRTIKIERQPTKIPGQPSWFMGLLDEHEGRIGVLDTGQLLYGKSRGGQRDLETNPFQRILITGDGRWGLACDEILSISRLQPDKVRWRTLREKRPWLIGTVIEELTAVIDVQQLVPHRKARL
ncbi:chemotaxis protein CheW [Methylomarinum vadi]|uniref:chemotaxis protein CheW n=1 Tax=Methylomarinum vadi TaxID=438855 RepID=UPI0004DEE055|nr:chemotaxis protein CheW [Methylomarinum vadi]